MTDSTVFGLTDGVTPADTDLFYVYRSGGLDRKLTWSSLKKAGPTGSRIYNVKDYGAKGDKTTDDTASIEAAITAMRSDFGRLPGSTGGQVLYFPPGWYTVTSTLDLSAMPDVRIIGCGGPFSIYGNTRPASILFYDGNESTPCVNLAGCHGVIWDGLSVYSWTGYPTALNQNSYAGTLVSLDNAVGGAGLLQMTIRNSMFQVNSGASSCVLLGLSGNVNATVENCGFWSAGSGTQVRMAKSGGSHSTFSNANSFIKCHFQGSRANSVLNPASQTAFFGCLFEQATGAEAAPIRVNTSLAYPAEVISFYGCGFWDTSGSASKPWVHTSVATNTWGFYGCYGTISPNGVFFDMSNHTGLVVSACQFNALSGTPNLFKPGQNITNAVMHGCTVRSPVVDNHASVFA